MWLSLLLPLLAVGIPGARSDTAAVNGTLVFVDDDSAMCLDGSRYGFYLRLADPSKWVVHFDGGGWCYDEESCLERAQTELGTSTLWPASAPMPYLSDGDPQDNPVFSKYSAAYLMYCDGASFVGYRATPVPVGNSTVTFRGIRNVVASLTALGPLGLASAEELIVTGNSAGGLATYLLADYVAAFVRATSPSARVVAAPIAGYFLDHAPLPTVPVTPYGDSMRYVFNMQNVSGQLDPACLLANPGPDTWRCILAPVAVQFVDTPLFALNSRFDRWQLANVLFAPCIENEPYYPPFLPSNCSKAEQLAVVSYGVDFMHAFASEEAGPNRGAFIAACIIHDLPTAVGTNLTVNGVTPLQAFSSWYFDTSNTSYYVEPCAHGPLGDDGPCNPSPLCGPYIPPPAAPGAPRDVGAV